MDQIVLRQGTVVDGSGQASFVGDVLIRGARIEAVAADIPVEDAQEVDARGLVVCPGLIDAHRHIDAALLRSPGYGEVELRQGITTALCGNCGFSLYPCPPERQGELLAFLAPIMGAAERAYPSLEAYARQVEACRPSINVGFLVGNGTVRMGLSGYARELAPGQLEESCALIDSALEAGAFGLSMGLMYSPENYYGQEELATLAQALARRGGVLATHIRGEGVGLARSVGEVIEIARQAGAALTISHFKAAGRASWGAVLEEAMAQVEEAIARGQDVACDAYPYEAGSTSLLTLLPPSWLQEGVDALARRLEAPAARRELGRILSEEQPDWDNIVCSSGLESIWIGSVERPENQALVGRSIAESAQRLGMDPVELMCDVIVSERANASIINFIVSQPNLRRVLCWAPVSVISDSVLPAGKPHPRYHGAFARVLAKCVREDRLLSLEEAVHRMSAKPARRYGLRNKGLIRPGYDADVVLFDPQQVEDRATYTDPCQLATGFEGVWLAGQRVVERDALVRTGGGRLLLRR